MNTHLCIPVTLRGLPRTSGPVRGFAAKPRAGCARDETEQAVVRARTGNKRGGFGGVFTGATGLEPATSGVTGDARANTILQAKTRKSTISSDFVQVAAGRFHGLSWGFRMVPPHPDPIAMSSRRAT